MIGFIRAFIAFVATCAAFVVPALLMVGAILGLADYASAYEMLKTWLAFVGPFAASVLGFYFSDRAR